MTETRIGRSKRVGSGCKCSDVVTLIQQRLVGPRTIHTMSPRRVIAIITAFVGALAISSTHVSAQTPTRVSGCWRINRPLGPTGSVAAVARDSAFDTVVLQDTGQVFFPRVAAASRALWEQRSKWYRRGDSVLVQIFTGLQGWQTSLVRSRNGRTMTGLARYLSDAIVIGAPELDVPVIFSSIVCDPSWPKATRAARKG